MVAYRSPGLLCCAGTYNDLIKSDLTAPCSLCPRGTTTAKEGSDAESDCQCEYNTLEYWFRVATTFGCAWEAFFWLKPIACQVSTEVIPEATNHAMLQGQILLARHRDVW